MEQQKIVHFLYVPFSGLGLYNGYRGDRWLQNRIKIFKQFVVPNLKREWKDNMVLWVSWREEERQNSEVIELEHMLIKIFYNVIFTYHGVCFWDDKYPDDEASIRLKTSLNWTLRKLSPYCQKADKVWMTIQPSDDVYLRIPDGNRGWSQGYIMNYTTGELAEYNPTTRPPFYTIEFPINTFLSPQAHYDYTGPYKSHEYVKDFLPMKYINERRFIVGVHGENISTGWDVPFKGRLVGSIPGMERLGVLKINRGWRRTLFFKLPHNIRRKLRYWVGEKFYAKIHRYVTNH